MSGVALLLGASAAPAPAPPLPPPGRTCTQSYGFLPCSDNAWGGAFLALVYGYMVLRGAMLIGDGGEALMDLKLAPAVIGGLVLPIIGALPDALIIMNAGLHERRSEAREEIAVGMGTLAGSTVMLLTIVWGGSVLLGRCDRDPATGAMRERTRRAPWHDLWHTGVSTDEATLGCAHWMLAAAGLYLVVQVPALFVHHTKHSHIALVGCICCFVMLFVYCGYQVLTPEVQRRRAVALRKHALRSLAVRSFSFAAQRFGGLLDPEGGVRRDATDRLFSRFKRDELGCLDASDVRSMLIGLEIAKPRWGAGSGGSGGGGRGGGGGGGSCAGLEDKLLDEHVALWMREFDPKRAGHISKEMFHTGVSRWVEAKLRRCPLAEDSKFQKARARDPLAANHQLLEHLDDVHMPLLLDTADQDADVYLADDSDMEAGSPRGSASRSGGSLSGGSDGPPPPAWQIASKAAWLLAAGTALCAAFSDPLVGTVTDVSRASGVHPFFLGFIFMPLASNASELVSSLAFAAGRTSNHISVTFNQVYGAVVMNSTLCFGVFLAIIYTRRLPWTFASEVAVILLPTLLLGALAVRRRHWRAAWGAAAVGMYPLVLIMQWGLMQLPRAH